MTVRTAAIITAIGLSVPLGVGQAVADPVVDGTFPVSAVSTNNQITWGPDGNIWLTLDGVAADYARITPAGVVTEFQNPTITSPIGITSGPDGNLWVTHPGAVARFSPDNPTVAAGVGIPSLVDPRAITTGPDGNLWTASGDKVYRIPTSAPDALAPVTEFSTTGVLGARWINPGSDGNLWVADFGGAQIVRVTTSGVGTTFPVGGGPQGVAPGLNGQIAYSNPGTVPQTVGRITTTAETTPTPLTDPFGVEFGDDDAYWFAQFASNNLGRLTPAGQYTTLPMPAGSGPRQITTGPNNTLWVTLDGTEQVARVSGVAPAPAPTPTPTPTPNPTPTPTLTTTITKKPKKVVRKLKVRFSFTGTTGAAFQCRMDKKAWNVCTSPRLYKVKPGKHVFRVRAVLNGTVDPSPATWRFRRR